MGTIDDYLGGIKKKYPDIKAVREQIEELRDTLNLKAEELQAQGLTCEEASSDSIKELGDLTPLLDQVSGNIRNIHINRIKRNNAWICSIIIIAEFLLCWPGIILDFKAIGDSGYEMSRFFTAGLLLCLFLLIWPLIAHMTYKRNPGKTEIVELPYKRLMHTALIFWLLISAILFIVNVFTGFPIWFIWPIIGVSNWPLNIYVYRRQLLSGRYDAPQAV